MIYNELIETIMIDLETKILLKYEPAELKKIQQYIEAQYELTTNKSSEYNNLNVREKSAFRDSIVISSENLQENLLDSKHSVLAKRIEFQNELLNFLNLLTLKFKNKGIADTKTMFMTGTCYAVLGKCYNTGLLGLKKNYEKAVEYLRKSAAFKNPMGTFELARCYDLGMGTDQDPEHACQLYRASYKLGYIRGLHKYGIMLIRGNLYVEKNIMDGFYILKQAIALNDMIYIRPYYDLGMLYKSGVSDTLNDHFYAFKIFISGAHKGCKYCQYRLGEEYENGNIETKNMEKAFYWYRMSAKNGLSDAQHKVATILYGIKNVVDIEKDMDTKFTVEGKVVLLAMSDKENYNRCSRLELGVLNNKSIVDFEKFYGEDFDRLKEAFQMALKAAIGGRKEAVLLVAEALEKGFGTTKNLAESIWWYKIADSLGCDNVREKINILESIMNRSNRRIC